MAGMKYKPSKKLKPWMLCQMRGQYLVPAYSRRKPLIGVWGEQKSLTVMMADGRLINVFVPAGVVIAGECSVLAVRP